ncbi:MAG: YeeE/YedE thiosulfate transporter family protein [Gammaproteobacteria bacterium]|nr:YeeE/YedE thiosulfate transporter family protein [Gammaproteobacteria bacterium]
MANFSFLSAFSGGIIIGFAALLMFLGLGRITEISSIAGGLLKPFDEQFSWRLIFILSIVVGGAVYPLLWGREIVVDVNAPWFIYPIAGLLVGFGTRMGSGCTSGHGICGVARFSTRSLVATMTFILSAMVTHGLYSAISG